VEEPAIAHHANQSINQSVDSSTKRVEEGQRREKIQNAQAQIRAPVGRVSSQAIPADEH
jgi:hypothetical protein